MSSVLIIEDDNDIREALSLLLADVGHAVFSAENGVEALRLLGGGLHPHVVILDLMMPVMSGWEVRERMLRDPALASIPTIVITGDRSWSDRGDRLHAFASLAKPFDVDHLLSIVDQVPVGDGKMGA